MNSNVHRKFGPVPIRNICAITINSINYVGQKKFALNPLPVPVKSRVVQLFLLRH